MISPAQGKQTQLEKLPQMHLYFLRRLKRFGLSAESLIDFYRCTVESILSGCITAWFGSCSAADRKALQRVVKTAERIIHCHLPTVQSIYHTRCLRKARKIIEYCSHPGNGLFTLLLSSRCYRSIQARTTKLKKSFVPPGHQASPPATPISLIILIYIYILFNIEIYNIYNI